MTWILKSTRSDRPVVAEYLCPVHGRFALEVARLDNGDPPAEATCPALGLGHPLYRPRPEDSAGDLRRAQRRGEWRCGAASPFAISAPGAVRVKNFEVVRGKWERPERPTYFDTRKLGEGQPLEEFRADRRRIWEEKRWHENKELFK